MGEVHELFPPDPLFEAALRQDEPERQPKKGFLSKLWYGLVHDLTVEEAGLAPTLVSEYHPEDYGFGARTPEEQEERDLLFAGTLEMIEQEQQRLEEPAQPENHLRLVQPPDQD